MTAAPAMFSHPAWLRAVLAQMPDKGMLLDGELSPPFAIHALQKKRFPVARAEAFQSALTPSALPSAADAPSVADARAYLDQLAMPLILGNVPSRHPVMQAMLEAAAHVQVLKQWQRAGLKLSGTFDDWLMANFDHKRRKELKRLRARLSEQGALTLDCLQPGGELKGHLAAFLTVEVAGWKGKRGTAIGNDPQLVKALEKGLAAMHALGKVKFWTLRLDGRPIASLFALVDGGEATLGKICYDESLGKFSPGVLLIIDATEDLFADPAITFADANAIPGHPMIDRIWRDRISCMDVVIAGPVVNSFTFRAVALGCGMKNAMRSAIKRVYLRVTGRRSS